MATFERLPRALRELRESRPGRLTQAELGRRAKVKASLISDYEGGRREPSMTTLAKLLEALDADLVDLQSALVGNPALPAGPSPSKGPASEGDEPINYFTVRLAVGALRDRGAVKELQEIAMSGKLPDLERAGETSGRVDKGKAPVRGKADRGNGS
jgi:transcriptional regulator with XRE-family HTH domain